MCLSRWVKISVCVFKHYGGHMLAERVGNDMCDVRRCLLTFRHFSLYLNQRDWPADRSLMSLMEGISQVTLMGCV